jgi:uncharacterized protein
MSDDKVGTDAGPAAVVRDFFATLSTGNFSALRAYLDDKSVWAVTHVDRGHPERVGVEAIVGDLLQPVREGLFEPGDPKVEIQRLLVDGDWVAVETIGRGTLLNGTPYANSYAFVIQVEGDKIRYLREYMDTAYAARVTQGVRSDRGEG